MHAQLVEFKLYVMQSDLRWMLSHAVSASRSPAGLHAFVLNSSSSCPHSPCPVPSTLGVRRVKFDGTVLMVALWSLGCWRKWAWTGGENYREWLIALPYYPANYLAGHFDVRNVLAHVRSDVREDGEGGVC